MSKQPETAFKEKAAEDLKTLPMVWFVKVQQITIRGTPDFLICVNGHFVAIELKKDRRSRPDPLQSYILDKIVCAGGTSFVAYPENWDEVFEKIKSLVLVNQVHH
jgi:hypothetical protein